MPEPLTPAQIAYEAWVRSKECPDVPPTPGQVAYEAAWRVHEELYPKAHRTPWRELHPAHKRGWEAAAQAVLAMQKDKPHA